MPAKKPAKSPGDLPMPKFFGKWADDVRKGHELEERTPRAPPIRLPRVNLLRNPYLETDQSPKPAYESGYESPAEVANWWMFRLVRAAAKSEDVEGYKRLLMYTLGRLGAPPPDGVMKPLKWPRGRPQEKASELIYAAWEARGKPAVGSRLLDGLAKEFYPNEFTRDANAATRKNIRDRIRITIMRLSEPPATK